MTIDKADNYLEQEFPKGNKFRGQAMVLLALATIDEKNRIFELIDRLHGEYKVCISGEELKKEINGK